MHAVTTGFFIGLVAILFGTGVRKSNDSAPDSIRSPSERNEQQLGNIPKQHLSI
jgi:hypothetical protein